MILIFEGTDNGGKSTICRHLVEQYDVRLDKFIRHHSPQEMEQIVLDTLIQPEKRNWKDGVTILDRWYYPSDLTNEPVYTGNDSILLPHKEFIEMKLRELGATLIYVNASLDTIEKRYNERGDEFVGFEQIAIVHGLYEDFMSQTDLPVFSVDTDELSVEESVDLIAREFNLRRRDEMKVATIVPAPMLDMDRGDDYFMCLYQEVKSNPKYAEYFRRKVEEGHFVIMDNGAAEGENPSWEELLEVYPLVNPSEVVLPDVVYNKEETQRQTREAYLAFERIKLRDSTEPKMRYMMVPQGENYTEWQECMKDFVQQHPVTIGISKFVTPKYQEEMGSDANVRMECVDAIVNFCGGVESMKRMGVEIHLLGCWDNPKEIGEIAKAFPGVVRGTDSAIAYVYTRNGVEYSPEVDRPDQDHIDFKKGDVVDAGLFLKNKELWRQYCIGEI